MTEWRAGIGEADFGTHSNAIVACRGALGQWFDILEEVRLTSSQLTGKPLRADLIAVARAEPNYVIAFEVKRGFFRMSEYAHAIKQATDYRLGSISDDRLPHLIGSRVCGAFVFPRWHGGHDGRDEYPREALAMEILSHHFRVGFADYDDGAVVLTMNDKRLCGSGEWSKTAPGVLGGRDRIGSQKLVDPSKISSRR